MNSRQKEIVLNYNQTPDIGYSENLEYIQAPVTVLDMSVNVIQSTSTFIDEDSETTVSDPLIDLSITLVIPFRPLPMGYYMDENGVQYYNPDGSLILKNVPRVFTSYKLPTKFILIGRAKS